MENITDFEIIGGSYVTTILVTKSGVTYKHSHNGGHEERKLELVMSGHGIEIREKQPVGMSKMLHWISLPYIVNFIDGVQVGRYDKSHRHEQERNHRSL
jgi:hypothetical protein